MPPPTLPPPSEPLFNLKPLTLEPLTPSAFAAFGTAISVPFPSALTAPPISSSTIPRTLHSPHQPQAMLANQDSALKTSPISIFTDDYTSSPSKQPSRPQMSMFSCFPRNLSGIGIESSPETRETTFKVDILERHPYTTQTFCPLGLSGDDDDTVYLVVIAPSLPGFCTATSSDGSSATITNPPDLSRLRAFLAHGDQAVTYGVGTWHAPMVVLGQRRVDFVVSQFVNGVAEDDCQEVLLGQSARRVDLKGLGLVAVAKARL